MKKTIRLSALALAALCLVSLLCACGGKALRNDVAVTELSAAVDKAIGSDKFSDAEESYVRGRLQIDLGLCESYIVRLSGVVDEYGVFKAKDADSLKLLEKQVQTYLDNRLATWMDEYMPEEKPKVENAKCQTFGNYVVYAILSDSSRAATFKAVEGALK